MSPETSETAPIRAVHDEFAGPLFVFAYRALSDRQAAEEVVQDTLVRAWRNAERFDPARGSMATWLFTIARNCITDRRRREAARPRSVGPPGECDLAGVGPVGDDLDRSLEAWQVSEALARLSPQHRGAIIEIYYCGCSTVEAAARLGVPPGTVKSRLYYGLRSLRLILEEMGVTS